MPRPTYSAETIADFFLSLADPDSNDVSNLKLQKLCYYAQGLCSAMRGAPLFSEPLEAWDHGPVVPALYHKFKTNVSSPIPVVTDFDEAQLDAADREALEDIYEFYGQYSAWRLRNMTHEERPWTDAYKSDDRVISVAALVSFFEDQIDDDYVRKVYGEGAAH